MPDSAKTLAFIRNTFRSVWSLELLLLLRSDDRHWPHGELVERLRGSDSIVRQGVDALVAAGLVVAEEGGTVRYVPASKDLERLSDNVELLYARRPDAVRRLIVLSSNDQLTAFADAFRLRRD
jgi:DNA-binding FadR family transcriptional regulator